MLHCTKFSTQTIAMHKKFAHGLWNRHRAATVVALRAMSEAQSRGGIMFRNWIRVTNDAVMLGFETQRVIGLRLIKYCGEGAQPR
jgi:hypothetical protein